jgi:hypothetical protein
MRFAQPEPAPVRLIMGNDGLNTLAGIHRQDYSGNARISESIIAGKRIML